MTLLVLRFLARYWQGTIATVAILAFVGMCHARDVAREHYGEAKERARVADSTLKVIAKQRPAIETAYVHDTRRVTKRIARTDTLRDSLLVHLTDTVRVKEFITTVGETNQACRDALGSCANLRRIDSLEIVALRSKAGVSSIPKPRRRCGFGLGGGYGATYDRTGIHTGPSLSAGMACSF